MMLSAVLSVVGLFWLAKAEDAYPYAANQTCPGKAWLADATEFRFSDGPNAPVKPLRTFESGYDFPYVVRLQEKLQKGQKIYFSGKFTSDAEHTRFFFLSQTNGKLEYDTGAIPLHIDVRMGTEVVLNAAKDGKWGSETQLKHKFYPNDLFEIHVEIADGRFDIYLNKVYAGTYLFLMPSDIIDHIRVQDGVELNELRVVGRYIITPFSTELNGNHLNLHDRIHIEADMWPMGAGKDDAVFDIKLLNEKDDVLFFFTVFFENEIVIRNSLINGEWGEDEWEGGFPFSRTASFSLEIVNGDDGLKVIVDGTDFTTFKHRTANPDDAYKKIELSQYFLPTVLEVCH
uniref:Galectin n=1 Tax=Panagrellus redivivus TaxID=6233 RepID=A0A7E4USZ7_PANRE